MKVAYTLRNGINVMEVLPDNPRVKVIQPQFERLDYVEGGFREGRVAVAIGGKLGYIDRTGKFRIQPQFDSARAFHDGLAAVRKDNLEGFIDESGRFAFSLPAGFTISSEWSTFSEGFSVVRTGDGLHGKAGYIDTAGKLLGLPQFDADGSSSFHGGRARVSINQKYGFINDKGTLSIQPQFDFALDFSDGLAAVKVANKWGFIDDSGKFVIRPQFADARVFSGGLAAVKLGNLWGFVDRSGKLIIQPQFQASYDTDNLMAYVMVHDGFFRGFREGLLPVNLDGKWGFVDVTGEVRIRPQFDGAKVFAEGLAAVRVGEKTGYIDREGKFVFQPTFSSVENVSEGMLPFSIENGRWGLLDLSACLR